jgi:hypothetical protein
MGSGVSRTMLMEQMDDYIDCVEVLYPNHQIAMEVDWSSGHMKYDDDAFRATDMNVGWGGKQPIMHASTLSEGDLGDLIPIYQPGDVQDMVLQMLIVGLIMILTQHLSILLTRKRSWKNSSQAAIKKESYGRIIRAWVSGKAKRNSPNSLGKRSLG